ncbi:MAG: nucleotidyltransferase family protein [Nitrososphaeraceae archaeon]
MKVVLLAGGRGTRARPFSDLVPKSMIPIEGRPVIDHVVRYLARFEDIDEILIVCEFDSFGNQIINYFEGKESIILKKISFIEDNKSGTGGAVLRVEDSIKDGSEPFLVWFADNLCALNLKNLVSRYHILKMQLESSKEIAGILVTRMHRHEETGRVIVKSKDCDKIEEFIEKPVAKLESPEALGIYLFSKVIFEYLHQHQESITQNKQTNSFNLSQDVLAHLPSKGANLYSYSLDDNTDWLDIESPVYADRNSKVISRIIEQMS